MTMIGPADPNAASDGSAPDTTQPSDYLAALRRTPTAGFGMNALGSFKPPSAIDQYQANLGQQAQDTAQYQQRNQYRQMCRRLRMSRSRWVVERRQDRQHGQHVPTGVTACIAEKDARRLEIVRQKSHQRSRKPHGQQTHKILSLHRANEPKQQRADRPHARARV